MWLSKQKLEQIKKAEFERGLMLGYIARDSLDKQKGGGLSKAKLEDEVNQIVRENWT